MLGSVRGIFAVRVCVPRPTFAFAVRNAQIVAAVHGEPA